MECNLEDKKVSDLAGPVGNVNGDHMGSHNLKFHNNLLRLSTTARTNGQLCGRWSTAQTGGNRLLFGPATATGGSSSNIYSNAEGIFNASKDTCYNDISGAHTNDERGAELFYDANNNTMP
jgi:hypothetical protein